MSKLILFILSLCASLYPLGTRAQEIRRQVVAVDEMFALADQHSKSLRPAYTALGEAGKAVKAAQNKPHKPSVQFLHRNHQFQLFARPRTILPSESVRLPAVPDQAKPPATRRFFCAPYTQTNTRHNSVTPHIIVGTHTRGKFDSSVQSNPSQLPGTPSVCQARTLQGPQTAEGERGTGFGDSFFPEWGRRKDRFEVAGSFP